MKDEVRNLISDLMKDEFHAVRNLISDLMKDEFHDVRSLIPAPPALTKLLEVMESS